MNSYDNGNNLLLLISMFITILLIVSTWKIYNKAGEHGWAAIIPFYNTFVFFKIAMGNGWFMLLTLIPLIGFVFNLIALYNLGTFFNKSTLFKIGLVILSPIFLVILAFTNSEDTKENIIDLQ